MFVELEVLVEPECGRKLHAVSASPLAFTYIAEESGLPVILARAPATGVHDVVGVIGIKTGHQEGT